MSQLLIRQMNVEPIIQSEVSQKEKNKYCVLMHIQGIQKDGTDELTCRTAVETETQRKALWTWQGKERVGSFETVCYAAKVKQGILPEKAF